MDKQGIEGSQPVDLSNHPSGIVPTLQNIVSTVNLDCKLDLNAIALQAGNAEYNPKRFAAVIMRIREPKTTALIFASGKMVCTGAKSEHQSKLAARKYARIIQKLGFTAKFKDFKIQNIVGSCDVKFPSRLEGLAYSHGAFSSNMEDGQDTGAIPTLLEGSIMADFLENGEDNELRVNSENQNASQVVSHVKCKKPPTTRPVKQVMTQPLTSKETKESDKTYSNMWEHFEKIKGTDRAKCLHCEKDYAADPKAHGTTGLWNHIDTCQKAPFNKRNENVTGQSLIHDFSVKEKGGSCSIVGIKSKALDIELIRETLSKMHIVDELAFNFVEGEGFREFVRVLEPRFTVPCRATVASDCFKLYDKEKLKLKKLLKDQRLSLTTDGWTSIQNLNYLVLTAHFIDDDWKMKKKILNFRIIESHKGQMIAKVVEGCLNEWGFDKILTVTVDNASSNDTTLRFLRLGNWREEVMKNKYLHVRCAAHIINLIVKEGLKEQSMSILKIRYAMKFVRSSPQRSKRFKECVLLEKIDCKKGVCLDVETRWNSTYLMLETATQYQKAFNRLRRDDSNYVDYFTSIQIDENVSLDGPPGKDDWEKIEAFVKFLGLFYEATLAFSGCNYVTSALFLRQIVMMYVTIKKLQGSNDLVMRKMADNMRAKFDKYWVNASVKNNLVLLGVVFDPRYKFKLINYCFKKLYGEDECGKISKEGGKMVDGMKLELEELYREYMDRYASNEMNSTVEGSRFSNSNLAVGTQTSNWEVFDSEFQMELDMEESLESKCELTQYLKEPCEKFGKFDILQWWKTNSTRYPVLSKIAKDVLAIPVSTVASEQAFSTEGRILNEFRSSLLPRTVEMLVCAQNWLKVKDDLLDIKSIMEDVEKYEDMSNGVNSTSNDS